jgi:polyferredoxin
MKKRVVRFGNELDLCFNCMRSPDVCDKPVMCTYTEATTHNKEMRHKTDPIQHFEGRQEAHVDYPVYGYGDYGV